MTATSQSKSDTKKSSRHINYNDQNDLLMNLCRNTYYKNKKKIKERLSIFKYKDEFISVRDNIEMIANFFRWINLNLMNISGMIKIDNVNFCCSNFKNYTF